MTNTIDFSNKKMQTATVSVMNDILASDATGNSMDDVYKTVRKYVDVTRAQFDDFYKEAEAKVAEWKNRGALSGQNSELEEEDLDMVVGGSIGSFFEAIGEGISNAANAVGNFVKEHALEAAIVTGCVIMAAVPLAIVGAAVVGYTFMTGAAVLAGAVAGGVAGTVLGVKMSDYFLTID